MDFTDLILDIEGYDMSLTITPYPTKFFVSRTSGVKQTLVFVSHRSNSIVDYKGGLFITYPTTPDNLFASTIGCS
jgi:hypothetical protein